MAMGYPYPRGGVWGMLGELWRTLSLWLRILIGGIMIAALVWLALSFVAR